MLLYFSTSAYNRNGRIVIIDKQQKIEKASRNKTKQRYGEKLILKMQSGDLIQLTSAVVVVVVVAVYVIVLVMLLIQHIFVCK